MRNSLVFMLAAACSPALADLSLPGHPPQRQESGRPHYPLRAPDLGACALDLVAPRDLWNALLTPGSDAADHAGPVGKFVSDSPPPSVLTQSGPAVGMQTSRDATLGFGASAFGPGGVGDETADLPPRPVKGSPLRTRDRGPSPAYLRPPVRAQAVFPAPSAALLAAVGLGTISWIRRRFS